MSNRWSEEKAQDWFNNHSWFMGFNYLPRTAINWIDLWQGSTFDEKTIEQELTWAAEIGYNTLRTNIPYTVWKDDRDGLVARINRFLQIASERDIHLMFCLFDDCGFSGDEPFLGPQKEPVHLLHNSQAAASPGREVVCDKSQWGDLEIYVKDILNTFKDDKRIAIWDLYNEPTNRAILRFGYEESFDEKLVTFAHELLVETFKWAREINPSQPLTTGAWQGNITVGGNETEIYLNKTDQFALDNSDVISFHAYCNKEQMETVIDLLKSYNRPMFCTEWLARHINNGVEDILPIFAENKIGCYQWGLVNGKTQTHFPWSIIQKEDENYAKQWFHDLLKADGSAYDEKEVELFKSLKTKY